MTVTLPLTLSSIMKFFPVSSLTNFTSTPMSTLSKSMVTYFLESSFFTEWAGCFSSLIVPDSCTVSSCLTSFSGFTEVMSCLTGAAVSAGTASMIFVVVSVVVVVVLTFSSVPARRAANTGPQTQNIIISAIMPPENRHGLKTKECKVFILILFFLQQF